MRDLLIRYLLGELNDAEQRQLEERLQQSPELRRELDYLRACFSEGNETGSPAAAEPPRGLAERTTEQALSGETPALSSASHSSVEPPVAPASWSLADISVAAGVFLAVSMLVLPALRGSRDASRQLSCANNQRQLGYYFIRYGMDHDGYFPPVRSRDNAGIFAARLVDEGYVTADELRRLLVCRASKQGDDVAAGHLIIRIPSVDALKAASPKEIERLVRLMAFSYAYRIGYVDRNRYYCYRNQRTSCQPILADAPSFDARGPRIVNHNGCGNNVLFADGRVRFQRIMFIAGLDDSLFLNTLNEAAAGQGEDDIVLGVPMATPRAEVPEAPIETPAAEIVPAVIKKVGR